MLWLSFHRDAKPSGPNELSLHLGGRVVFAASELSEPGAGVCGLREISNQRALISQVAERRLVIESIGIWNAAQGGELLLTAAVHPALVVEAGDPAAFFSGQLLLRATASVL